LTLDLSSLLLHFNAYFYILATFVYHASFSDHYSIIPNGRVYTFPCCQMQYATSQILTFCLLSPLAFSLKHSVGKCCGCVRDNHVVPIVLDQPTSESVYFALSSHLSSSSLPMLFSLLSGFHSLSLPSTPKPSHLIMQSGREFIKIKQIPFKPHLL